MLLIDNSQIYADIEHLLKNDADFLSYDLSPQDIPWEAFESGFAGFVRILQSQQISFKGALSLWNKLLNDVGEIAPDRMQRLSVDALKSYGFSKQKQLYLNDLCDASIDFAQHETMSDKEIIEQIQFVKGFGLWSAQAYLMLCLQRPNIFPLRDLVIDKALQHIEKLENRPSVNWVSDYATK